MATTIKELAVRLEMRVDSVKSDADLPQGIASGTELTVDQMQAVFDKVEERRAQVMSDVQGDVEVGDDSIGEPELVIADEDIEEDNGDDEDDEVVAEPLPDFGNGSNGDSNDTGGVTMIVEESNGGRRPWWHWFAGCLGVLILLTACGGLLGTITAPWWTDLLIGAGDDPLTDTAAPEPIVVESSKKSVVVVPAEAMVPAEAQVVGPEPLTVLTRGEWEVAFYEGHTSQMIGWFDSLRDPAPELWPVFPNQPNPELSQAEWRVVYGEAGDPQTPDGLEYGLDESVFMEQNEFGQFPVQARGYRFISGDYNIPGIDACEAEGGSGCAIAIFNVGEVTADLEATVRQGFTVPGRYWNGDSLEIAMWGLASHTSANMLNYETFGAGDDTLNRPSRTNAGANCSVPDGCEDVRWTLVITSGNQLLVKAITFIEG